jgi:hypothetical protein
VYLLRAEPTFVKTVSAALILARRHLRLGVAKDLVERLWDREDVTVEVPMVESRELFEQELRELGVEAIRRETKAASAQAFTLQSQS